MEAAAQVRKTKLGGSLLNLARARDEQYNTGRARLFRNIGRAEWTEEDDDEEEDKAGIDAIVQSKLQSRLDRFGKLALPGSQLVLNLRKKKSLLNSSKASHRTDN